jgi:hypothetical protein
MHVVFLLEELSAQALLLELLPRLLPAGTSFEQVVFQGKKDLLAQLAKRLKAYKQWIPPTGASSSCSTRTGKTAGA